MIVYKQRHINSNRKISAGKNYAHIRYIATRPRVFKNEGMHHGLFGKLGKEKTEHYKKWQDIAKIVYDNTKAGTIMYRAIIAPSQEMLSTFLINDQESWKAYIEEHITSLAKGNNIDRKNLAWVAAAHNEIGHQHIHVCFWDKTSNIRDSFVSPKIPNAIRKDLIKNTYREQILELMKQKTTSAKSMRDITNEMVDDFEKQLRMISLKKYRAIRHSYDEEQELTDSFCFADDKLNKIADKVFRIKSSLPPKGRVSYQLLPPEVKTEVDHMVSYIIKHNTEIKKMRDEYVNSKMEVTSLYGGTDEYFDKQKSKYESEADKIIANRVLGMVKTLNRLDFEGKSSQYQEQRKDFYTAQMMYSIMDMLTRATAHHNSTFSNHGFSKSELSKDAKKELAIKYQDKGYEH